MRFKDFLNEEGPLPTSPISTEIKSEEALEWIKHHASKYIHRLKNGEDEIWRGVNPVAMKGAFNLGDSFKFKRRSISTQNYYTKIIASSKKWKDYPSREHSFICATNKNVAAGFGVPYVVIPADNAKIGVCPTSDIWSSFREPMIEVFSTRSLVGVNNLILEIGLLLDKKAPSDTDAEKLNHTLESWSFDEIKFISTLSDLQRHIRYDLQSAVEFMEANNMTNFKQLVDYIIDPDTNGFTHTTIANYVNDASVGREVWISGEMLFVSQDDFKNLMKDIE